MYQTDWEIKPSTLPSDEDPTLYLQSASVIEAMARIDFSLQSGYRLVLLAGHPGVGKSFLLRQIAGSSDGPLHELVHLSLLGVSHDEFLTELALQLGESHAVRREMTWIWRRVRDHLKVSAFQQVRTTLLLDDASDATDDVLNTVVRLAQGDPRSVSMLSIVLAVDDERIANLRPRLLDMCQLRIDLHPWDISETEEFLGMLAAAAGAQPNVFDTESARTIHQLADGNARRIRHLAELTLLAAAGCRASNLNADLVTAVHQELTAYPS